MAFADSNIETKICRQFAEPTIIAPTPGTETKDASVTVTGVGEPGMAVSILRNGVIAGTTTAVIDGSYGIEIGLNVGDNVLMAREVNDCGTVEDSVSVAVHRTVVESSQTPTSSGKESSEISGPSLDSETEEIHPAVPAMHLPITSLVDTQGFVKPTIALPASGAAFNTTQVWVGGQAQPGSVVTVYLNDRSAAQGIATEKGVYGALLSLSPGKNTIQVRSILGDEMATSESIEVTFEQDETLTITATAPPSTLGTVAAQVTLVAAASVTVTGVATWSVPELRHLVRLRWFK
jgi:hypothetical protein